MCLDFFFFFYFIWGNDIVDSLHAYHKNFFISANVEVKFTINDLVCPSSGENKIPKVDLIIVRDVIQHNSLVDIQNVICHSYLIFE